MLVSLALAAWPGLDPLPPRGGSERDAALLVGIEDYLVLPDVPGARSNLTAWADWLVHHRQLPIDHVHLLADGDATREQVLEHLREAAGQVGEGGRLWFVWVGHGAAALDGTDGWLVGADAQPNPKSLEARSVPRKAVLDALGDTPTVAVLDACFSGRAPDGSMLVEGLQPIVPTWALPEVAPRVQVFAAAQADQVAGPLRGGQRPAFSYLLLGALRGWADDGGDGQVTAAEALAYARRALAVTEPGRDQVPTFDGDPELVLGTGNERGPDLLAAAVSPLATPQPLPAPVSPSRARLDEILRLRNSPNGQRTLEEDQRTAYPGVGFRGIIAGRSTLSDVLDLAAINTFHDCWLDGPRMKEPVRCHDLNPRKLPLATSLVMPSFHAYAPDDGVVRFIEIPPFDHATPVSVDASDVTTIDGVTLGMPRDEVVARLGAPDADHGNSLHWHDLGLQLLLDGEGQVEVMRIFAAEGVATR